MHARFSPMIRRSLSAALSLALAGCASTPRPEALSEPEAAVETGVLAPAPAIAMAPVESELAAQPAALGRTVAAEQILALPAEYYAVQLVAFRDKRDVLDYIARHELGDPPYGRVLRQGEVWYVLIYGVWANRAEAEAAVAAMPESLRKSAPWVRKLGDLQAAIRALM